jgi:hypothetical protein
VKNNNGLSIGMVLAPRHSGARGAFAMNRPVRALRAGLGVFLAIAVLFIPKLSSSVNALSDFAENRVFPLHNRPRQLIAVKSRPLSAEGKLLGTVVVYDDLSTARPDDYQEIYNRDGDLVAVVWFDRFGIQRLAIDRAFAEGKAQAEGVFIAVVKGDFV